MAVRQYIGARYVPKFMGNYSSETAYEPLSIVLYNNSNYTSKIPVPAGILPTNETYWALTGNYNEQIEEYRQEAQTALAIGNEIKKHDYWYGKKIVAYGDSSGTSAHNFVTNLINNYDMDITNRCVGGSFLTEPSVSGYTPGVTLLDNATDLGDFDTCLIIYGINDWQLSRSLNVYKDAVLHVIKRFKDLNCEPVFIFPWYCQKVFTIGGSGFFNNEVGSDLYGYTDLGIDVCESYGVKYVNLAKETRVRYENYATWLNNDDGTYVHALENLSDAAADVIASGKFNTGRNFEGGNGQNVAMLCVNCTWSYTGTDRPVYPFALPGSSNVPALSPTAEYRYIHVTGHVYGDPSTNYTIYPARVIGSTSPSTDYYHNRNISCRGGEDFSFYTYTDFTGIYPYITSGTDAYIGNLNIEVTGTPLTPTITTPTSSMTFTKTPRWFVSDGCFNMDGFSAATTAQITAGNNVLAIGYNTNANSIIIASESGGTVYPLHLEGGYIKALTTIPSGVALFIPAIKIPIAV